MKQELLLSNYEFDPEVAKKVTPKITHCLKSEPFIKLKLIKC